MSVASPIDAILDTALLRSIPINVLFELTHRCNLRCAHCYIVKHADNEMNTEQVKDALDQLAEAGCLFLAFSGGEALLRDDFFEIVTYAKRKNFAVKLLTNGTLVDSAIADKIADLKPTDVSISIYGHDAGTHDDTTGVVGSYERSVDALRLLHARGVKTNLKCLIMNRNIDHIQEIWSLARELGARPLFDPLVTPRNDGDVTPLKTQANEEELTRIVFVSTGLSDSIIERNKSKSRRRKEDLQRYTPCRAGRDTCAVTPSGEVLPCVQFPLSFGNVKEQSFKLIWESSKERMRLMSIRVSDLGECVSCEYQKSCRYCWGLAFIETGSINSASPTNCRQAKMLAKATSI